jgi:hypothetical protein
MQTSRRYALSRAPKLVEIIAAVPEEHKPRLLPQVGVPCMPCLQGSCCHNAQQQPVLAAANSTTTQQILENAPP